MFVYMLISEYLDKIEWFVEFILASEDLEELTYAYNNINNNYITEPVIRNT
jgi:hypothetical protein